MNALRQFNRGTGRKKTQQKGVSTAGSRSHICKGPLGRKVDTWGALSCVSAQTVKRVVIRFEVNHTQFPTGQLVPVPEKSV